jgi:hypothetical protein
MESYKALVGTRGIGITSLIFGFLGAAFYWWLPLGIVLSLTGLVMGFVGWTMARSKTVGFGLSLAGMLLSLAALIWDWVIADLGLELIKLHSLR